MINKRLRTEYTLDGRTCDVCGAPARGLMPFVHVQGRCGAFCCDEHQEMIIEHTEWVPLMRLVKEAENGQP